MKYLLLVILVLSQDFIRASCQRRFDQHTGIYSRHVREGEVTIPQKVTPSGHPLPGDLTHFHKQPHSRGRRLKRDILVPTDTLHYKLKVAGREEVLDLEPSRGFISPVLRVRRGLRTSKVSEDKTRCHYRGVVRGRHDSTVALSACDGLAGMLRMGRAEYWLEPAAANLTSGAGARPHILFQRTPARTRNRARHRRRRKRKRKKKHEKNCGTREPRRVPASRLEWAKQAGVKIQGRGRKGPKPRLRDKPRPFKKAYKYKIVKGVKRRERRSVSREHHVEALLVADASMVEFHHDGDVEMYLLTVMNIVSSLYQEPSIGNFINIVVVNIVLIEDDWSEGLNITVNADNALGSFCQWQERHNPTNELDPQHHDIAILVTRKDICARQDTPCSTLGVAHVGGMCTPARSCNINEDNGITLAHTIAHEMGHNFGMFHDSAKSGCVPRRGHTLHVMTPTFEADSLHIAWSPCSRRDITHFLDQGLGTCLEDQPVEQDDYTYPELPPGAMYNADYQCRLQFGPDSSVCSPTEEICSRLWCMVDGMCTTNLYPAAPGTHCDKHMWCVNQQCVPIGDVPEPIAGGWGEWGEWSVCSRTCGAGVSIMERLCDHPSPAHGGSYCVGERSRYKICNTQPCPESPFSFRAEQCASYNDQPYFGKNYTWLPYFETSEPCELYCTDSEDTIIASLGESAIDGTPCNLGSRDMCISGICRKVGCDWQVDSDAEEDKCGVCHGDGKLCSTQKGYYNNTDGDGYTEVAIMPKDARNIRVEEMSSTRNYIAVGAVSGNMFYLNGNGEVMMPGEHTIAGSAALYERHKELDKLRIPGPIHEDILVYVMFRDHNPGVYFEFTLPNDNTEVVHEYRWELSDWSTCTATCGGGEQVARAVCRTKNKDVVEASKCEGEARPSDRMRTCNLHPCPVRWWIGPWQLCPVTCGEQAVRKRTVLCVSGGKELALPDGECARQPRPPDTEPCPDIPPCLTFTPVLLAALDNSTHKPPLIESANRIQIKPKKGSEILAAKGRYDLDKWSVLPWSQCSVTCGVGFKKRTIHCTTHKCDISTKPISVKQCFRHCHKLSL